MNILIRRIKLTATPIIALLIAAFAPSLYAQSFQFTIDPQAKIFNQDTEQNNDYTLALGKYKKRGNRWLPEKAERAEGELSRYTLELPRHFDEDEVFEFYRSQLPETAKLLFTCKSRACGDSNNWANDHFGVKQLYGTNTSQHFALFMLEGEQLQYITIYTVRRGNRRLYTQLETLLSSQ